MKTSAPLLLKDYHSLLSCRDNQGHLLLYVSKTIRVFCQDDNVFIYFSKRLQCLQSFMLQKTTMSSFTFRRRQCFQSFMLSKGENVFIYISKTTLSSIIYAFKRLQCLHLHFEDDNVFIHLCFQKATMIYISKMTMSSVIYTFKRRQCLHSHFQRLQCLFSFIGLNVLVCAS